MMFFFSHTDIQNVKKSFKIIVVVEFFFKVLKFFAGEEYSVFLNPKKNKRFVFSPILSDDVKRKFYFNKDLPKTETHPKFHLQYF